MDNTEQLRRERMQELNSNAAEREILEERYGQVWDTQQLQEEFVVQGFAAPFVAVKKKDNGEEGTLEFQHMPRYYFSYKSN